tara:strand:- start:464 stop:832 length:369 start_codon:yes stop_codon:yes gene_type:complete
MRKNKALISIVIILGLIIILGLGALIFGLYEKANDPSFSFFKQTALTNNLTTGTTNNIVEKNIKSKKNISIPLAKSERVKQIAASDNKIILLITNKFENSRLLIIDANNGAVISHIEFKNSQ